MTRVPEEQGHTHDFDLSQMKPSDTFHTVRTTLNGQDTRSYHDHEVIIFFDRDKKKFILETGPGGRDFRGQHTHPTMERSPGEMDGGPLENVNKPE